MAIIEDDFSDPEDQPLDAAPLPTPAAKANRVAPQIASGQGFQGQAGYKEVAEEMYKGWETIYPIYIDAKRPQKDGARRVNKTTAVEWPIAEFMAHACGMLGVQNVLEPTKSHPKDWANPGRIKVLLKEDGKLKNPAIKNKRALLQQICALLKPHQPKPTTPGGLPPIDKRLPALSPAISHGLLESSAKGGGMGGMLGNLLGGGAADEPEETPAIEAPKKKELPKLKKIRQGRRR